MNIYNQTFEQLLDNNVEEGQAKRSRHNLDPGNKQKVPGTDFKTDVLK